MTNHLPVYLPCDPDLHVSEGLKFLIAPLVVGRGVLTAAHEVHFSHLKRVALGKEVIEVIWVLLLFILC